ncbi:hypothetical protein BH18ACT4_BH18ACT4_00990 [soil metagenome]
MASPAERLRVREPIILIGAPRSGTSLMADLIGAHPDVAVAREPRLVWRFGNDRRSDELRPAQATPQIVDHIHANLARVLTGARAERLVEKTPANAVRPAFVDAVFPDARFVHITRNGWGAVPSMRSFWERRGAGLDAKQIRKLSRRLREAHPSQVRFYLSELVRRTPLSARRTSLYGPRLAGLQQVADELGHLEAAGLQWRTCVDQTSAFGRALPSHRYLQLRLESLDPESIKSVVEFCGLRPSSEVLDRFDDLYDADVARRQAPLNPDEQATVSPYVAAGNAWLGYPEAPATAAAEMAEG